MRPLVGLELSGATLTPFDDFAVGQGVLGRPVWGPGEFLQDLELRLGLSGSAGGGGHAGGAGGGGTGELGHLRTAQWAARMDLLIGVARFFSASFAVDRLGTAQAVLELRDSLVSAGWDGAVVPNGGPRLQALAELEALKDVEVSPGVCDRVRQVALALEGHAVEGCSMGRCVYDQLTLAENAACWSGAWNRVFRALARTGTDISQLTVTLPGAPAGTDLGEVQVGLRSGSGDGRLRGDGSFIRIVGETAFEAAEAAVALLCGASAEQCVVIREGDSSALEHAFWVQQVPGLGLSGASRWRPALQLLPLALELAFEPKDPFRVLELLSLPQGPFMGRVGRRLARALARSPGIGGRAWEEAKARLPEPREEVLQQIAAWLEAPGADPIAGAPKADLLQRIDRVRRFVVARIARTPTDTTLFAALQHAGAVAAVLETDRRESFDLVSLRGLADFALGAGASTALIAEGAGRVAHVSTAQALWVPRQTVVWWPFCDAASRPLVRGWRPHEVVALEHAGLPVSQAGVIERQRWSGWRRAVSAATERLILVAPRSMAGQLQRPHPLWDEIVAKLELDETAQARVTRTVDSLGGYERHHAQRVVGAMPNVGAKLAVNVEWLAPLALPSAPATWRVSFSAPPRFAPRSAASLNALLSCPLRWALERLAGLESEDPGLPELHLLEGTLGHRLFEELVLSGALERAIDADVFEERAQRSVDVLIQQEGALLLRSGKAHELAQVRQRLVAAVRALREVLRVNDLTIVAVERTFDVSWREGSLAGRWDLLVRTRAGCPGVIDVKLGHSEYKKRLESGTALQLATYVRALQLSESREAFASYFSLRKRRLFGPADTELEDMATARGPSLTETWRRIERTLPLVEARVTEGVLDASGVDMALPLLETLGIPEQQRAEYFATLPSQICKHCRFDGVCGKRWEPQR